MPALPVTRDLALTFAGGGNRAFYQFGLMRAWGPRLWPRIGAIATCSAGACVAAMWIAGREDAARTLWLDRTRDIRRNLDWRRPLRGETLAPHGRILREVLLAIGEGGGLDRIRAAPFPIVVVASAFPDILPPGLAVLVGIGAYQIERALRPVQLHPRLGRRIAFEPVLFDMRECASPDDLADLVLSSSATPPFTPVGRYRGRVLLDGGMVDNAPAFAVESLAGVTRNMVMLTRPYATGVGRQGRRFYIAPSQPPPLERWDYTRPHLMEETVALGERDAAALRSDIEAFLAEDMPVYGGRPATDGAAGDPPAVTAPTSNG